MANGESVIIDPKTGQSLNPDDPDTEKARENRLKYMRSIELLREGDEEGYGRLMAELTVKEGGEEESSK